MYLARKRIAGRTHYTIRESYLDAGAYLCRDLFELGAEPARFLRNEIYSMFVVGSQLKEIRVPISNKSIAGYVANTGKMVNIADVYGREELKSIDKELAFDYSWDKKSGFRTKQVLAAPIIYDKTLKGAIQILNRKGAGKFTEDEQGFLLEIADVLGIALNNQERFVRRRKTRFDYLLSARGLLKEDELDGAWDRSREEKESMEAFLMSKYKVSKDDIVKSYEDHFRCKVIPFSDKFPIPGDLLKNLKKEFLSPPERAGSSPRP